MCKKLLLCFYCSFLPTVVLPLMFCLPCSATPKRDELKAGEVRKFEIADKVFMEFCYIPPGEAKLGSMKDEYTAVENALKKYRRESYKKPEWLKLESFRMPRTFKSKGFWLGKYEVTQGEWKAIMGINPSHFSKVREGSRVDRLPVDSVTWEDCKEFLKKLNKKPEFAQLFGESSKCILPNEDEWEYAYRGLESNAHSYYWGDELNGMQANCNGEGPFGTDKQGQFLARTCEVDDTNGGKYPAHPWGLCHMSGNVWEWCEDIHTSPDKYIQCGGSWFSAAWDCRAVSRFDESQIPGVNMNDLFKFTFGLRVCVRLE